MLEKTEGANKYGQSRHRQHWIQDTEQRQTDKNTTQKTKKNE